MAHVSSLLLGLLLWTSDPVARPVRVRPLPEPKPLILQFPDDLVGRDRFGPDSTTVSRRPTATMPSLLPVRRHFVPEMLKSAENL